VIDPPLLFKLVVGSGLVMTAAGGIGVVAGTLQLLARFAS
jgi:hypothetical protein